jgi:hypothetical protein
LFVSAESGSSELCITSICGRCMLRVLCSLALPVTP